MTRTSFPRYAWMVMTIMCIVASSAVCMAQTDRASEAPGLAQSDLMQALHGPSVSLIADTADLPGNGKPPKVTGPPDGEHHGQGYLHRSEPRSKAKGKAWGPGGKKKKNKEFGGGPDEPEAFVETPSVPAAQVEAQADPEPVELVEALSIPTAEVETQAVPEPGSLLILGGGLITLAGTAIRRRW